MQQSKTIETLNQNLINLLNSKSMKITKPFRQIARLLRGELKR